MAPHDLIRRRAKALKAVPSFAFAALLFVASPGGAVEPGAVTTLSLSSFSISPRELHLSAGRLVLLHINNDSSDRHDLTAQEFFSAAAVRADSAAAIVDGKIALDPHQQVVVALIPTAGRYPAKCSHTMHKLLGMSGTIVVDR